MIGDAIMAEGYKFNRQQQSQNKFQTLSVQCSKASSEKLVLRAIGYFQFISKQPLSIEEKTIKRLVQAMFVVTMHS